MILNNFRKHHFFIIFGQNFRSKMTTLSHAFTKPETIDLRFGIWNPHQNDMNQHAKILQTQTNGQISQTHHFEGQKSPRCHFLKNLKLAPV